MTTTRKRSRQRDSILAFLGSRKDHPTAETVYLHIREDIPNISLATVYRNLSLLAQMGEIRKLTPGNGPDRFDAFTHPHDHFICNVCGCVMDIEPDVAATHVQVVDRAFPGRIDGHHTYFHGLCPACLEKETKAG